MDTENNMVLGDPYPASCDKPDYTDEEKIQITEDYLMSNFNPGEIMEMVVEEWDYTELYGIMMRNEIRFVFNKLALSFFTKKIFEEYGFYPCGDQVMDFLRA